MSHEYASCPFQSLIVFSNTVYFQTGSSIQFEFQSLIVFSNTRLRDSKSVSIFSFNHLQCSPIHVYRLLEILDMLFQSLIVFSNTCGRMIPYGSSYWFQSLIVFSNTTMTGFWYCNGTGFNHLQCSLIHNFVFAKILFQKVFQSLIVFSNTLLSNF